MKLLVVLLVVCGAVSARRITPKRVEIDYFANDKELTIPEEDEDKPPSDFKGDVKMATIQNAENRMYGKGKFKNSFETQNGIQISQVGKLKDNKTFVVSGSYSYTGADGKRYRVRYTADEFGYHPKTELDLDIPDLMIPEPIKRPALQSNFKKIVFNQRFGAGGVGGNGANGLGGKGKVSNDEGLSGNGKGGRFGGNKEGGSNTYLPPKKPDSNYLPPKPAAENIYLPPTKTPTITAKPTYRAVTPATKVNNIPSRTSGPTYLPPLANPTTKATPKPAQRPVPNPAPRLPSPTNVPNRKSGPTYLPPLANPTTKATPRPAERPVPTQAPRLPTTTKKQVTPKITPKTTPKPTPSRAAYTQAPKSPSTTRATAKPTPKATTKPSIYLPPFVSPKNTKPVTVVDKTLPKLSSVVPKSESQFTYGKATPPPSQAYAQTYSPPKGYLPPATYLPPVGAQSTKRS